MWLVRRLNVASKSVALVAAALLLLDFASTSVVSAATAMSYLDGEVSLPFPIVVGCLVVFVIFTFISLSGMRESARTALVVLTLHVSEVPSFVITVAESSLSQIVTMVALFVASFVAWHRAGNAQIRENWSVGTQSLTPATIARKIFDGICIGVLGLTGFECTFFTTLRL